jgi:DUF218 domain
MIKLTNTIAFLFFALLVFGGFVLYSPQYLLYSSECKKADAIILLVGPDFNTRKKEANKLIEQGMTDYLIVSGHNKIYKIDKDRIIKEISSNLFQSTTDKKMVQARAFYCEDTHLEIIEAQKMMEYYKLNSAIFVSSPYHMRRIKVIASRVFNTNKNSFYFVPTRYEKTSGIFWQIPLADWKKIIREYFKIIWFLIYINWMN